MSLLDAIRRARAGHPPTRGSAFDPDGDPGPPIALDGTRVLLVYLFPNLGDVILLLPVIKALLDAGAERVGVLARKNPARVFKLVDLPIKVHTLPDALALPAVAAGHEATWAEPEVVSAADAFADRLKSGKYDVAIDLTTRADIESRRWVWSTGARHRLGWEVDGERLEDSGLTFATPDLRHLTDRHWSRAQMVPLRCLGVSEPAFDEPWVVRENATLKTTELYGEGEIRVLIVPGSGMAEKRWPPERFAVVGGRLANALRARVVVTGAPSESALVKSLATRIGGDTGTYTGKDLGTLLALVRDADLVITNDTAPMHLAFLCERPTVAIFTWMSAVSWGPPRRDPQFVVFNAPSAPSDAAASTWTEAIYEQALRLLAK